MILSDISIRKLCTPEHNFQADFPFINRKTAPIGEPMISPFVNECVRKYDNGEKVISYGLSSFGYDVRLSNKFKIFTNVHSATIDPKNLNPEAMVDVVADHVWIPANSYILGSTIERFKIPRDIMVECLGKSTYARCGAIVNVTPIEPEFEGEVVIEISNATNSPLKVYAGEGIAQFMFFLGDRPCEVSYADRGGKYQKQTGVTLPRM